MASFEAGTSSGMKYDVFLSFSGPDTGVTFTDFLYHSLIDAGICVFRDDEELRGGERTDGLLQRAIGNSRIYIPIFSQTYAFNPWCLRELAQIVASRLEGNKVILPIFFDADPRDVRLKTPLYRDAIMSLEREETLSNVEVDAWKKALMEVGEIQGWEVKNYKSHSRVIKLVVEEVMNKLKRKHRSVPEYLVGIDDHVAAVTKLLDINSGGVKLINIHGMGGIGKTTLANVIFNQMSFHFGKYSCFLEEIRMNSERTGLVELQKKLLYEISHPMGARRLDDIDHGMMMIGEVLRNKKVLIVLDDVDNHEQVEKLVGSGTLYPGSRILITTRDKNVLQINRPKYEILSYPMELMSADHALELFNRHAFNQDSPSDDYKDLSIQIVPATGRLPLALEVIGSLLSRKPQVEWEETLQNLENAPHDDVLKMLRISYDALTFEEQQIFLDIACFFVGEDKTNAIYMWNDCEFNPNIVVDALVNKCLVKIVEDNKFWMSEQLIYLGRDIIREEYPMNPGLRSRIWICEEILDAIQTEEIKKNVQALYLDRDPQRSHDVIVQSKGIGRFEHLRFLKLTGGTIVGDAVTRLPELRWISWNYPLCIYKWANMDLEKVVILELSGLDILNKSRLQNLIKTASKLKVLSLKSCHNIIETPDFSGCPKLERLTLEDCSKLKKIDGSIGKLKCLIDLKIDFCSCLEYLPKEIRDLVNLKHFSVKQCNAKKLPDSIWKLEQLREVHFSSISDGSDLASSWELPTAIGMLQNLEVLLVNSRCLKGRLPSEIRSLPSLTVLNLSLTDVSEVPGTISELTNLQRLELMECHKIQKLPALPTSLTHLQVSSASLREVPNLSNLTNLVELNLDDIGGGDILCTGDLRWIGKLSVLTKLKLGLHGVPAPAELASLPQLNQLDLFGLDLQTFPQLSFSLQKLGLDNFHSIVSLSPNLRKLSSLELSQSPVPEVQLDGLQLPHLKELLVQNCESLERFKLSSMRKLKDVQVRDCPKLLEIRFSCVWESLEALSIKGCRSLGRLVHVGEAGHDDNESAKELITREGGLILPSRALKKLQSFMLVGCHKILEIQVVGTSESWRHFEIGRCPHVRSLGDLSNLKNLKSLHIQHNDGLQVVKGLDELAFLNDLRVHGCGSLERLIDVSSTKLPNHCNIHISGCRKSFRGSFLSYKHHKDSHSGWTCTCFRSV